MVDVLYLDNKIKESGKSKTFLADKCGISRANFYMKINGKRHFTETEATRLCEALGVSSLAERKKIFLLD